MVVIAKATDSEPASVVSVIWTAAAPNDLPRCGWTSPRRCDDLVQCLLAAVLGGGKQGECLGQVWVLTGGRLAVVSIVQGIKLKKEEARHCRKRGPSAGRADGVTFGEKGVGSVKGQQREQCSNERGQKGWHEQRKLWSDEKLHITQLNS